MGNFRSFFFAWVFVISSGSLALGALSITEVTPNLVLAADRLGNGGTAVAILGTGFRATDTVTIGKKELLDKKYVDATRVEGRIPYLEPNFYDVVVQPLIGKAVTLSRAVEVTPPVTITSVTPGTVSRFGGTAVTITGRNFRPVTKIKFGIHHLLSLRWEDASIISGIAPALEPVEPDGKYDVIAEDSRGKVTLTGGVTYFNPITLIAVEPSLVSTLGGTPVTFIGTGFTPGWTLKLGGVNLTEVAFVDSEHMTGKSPALAEGFHDATILSPPGAMVISRTLPDAVEAAPPPTIRLVTPKDVTAEPATPVSITGARFRTQTKVYFGTHEILEAQLVSSGEIQGKAPPLGPTEAPGFKDVKVQDSRGSDTLKAGVNYITPPSLILSSVSPTLISTKGGQELTFIGKGFRAGDILSLVPVAGTAPLNLTGVTFVDSTRMKGLTPALNAGFYSARVSEPTTGVSATLQRAVEAAPPPLIKSINPNKVPTTGGTAVAITGENLRSITVFKLGDLALLNPNVSANGGSVVGTAPAQSAGVKDVTAEDSRGKAVLTAAITYYVPEQTTIPGPQVTETALAYGKARFEWENFHAYDQIEVLDANGRVLDTIAGTATSYEVATGGAKAMARQFRGVTREYGRTRPGMGIAKVFQCDVPPSLQGLFTPKEPYRDDAIEFTLNGGHSESGDVACADGGGPIELKFDCGKNGLAHAQVAASSLKEQTGGAAGSGVTGYAVSPNAYQDVNQSIFKGIDSNKLTTGFVLPADSDKLEIAVYGRKIAVAYGLELRGRLIHVFPNDGFADEFPFPDTIISGDQDWITALYYRTYVDNEGARQPCLEGGELKKIPAGEYLLDLYAVGGNRKIPYFGVLDDPLDIELLIAGSPCPPYPRVRVTDLSGLRTVPQICCIKPEVVHVPGDLFDTLGVNFRAQGIWTDFDNTQYCLQEDRKLCCTETSSGHDCPGCAAIPDSMPVSSSPDFHYTWYIYEKDERPVPRTTHSPTAYITLPEWGCYYVELTVRDMKCGLESKYATQVAVIPEADVCSDSNRQCDAPASTTQMKSSFLFPSPNPGSMVGVVGLRDANVTDSGKFDGTRPIKFNFLVAPCYCDDPMGCPSPMLYDTSNPPDPVEQENNTNTGDDDIEIRMAVRKIQIQGDGSFTVTYTKLENVPIKVTDPCCEVTEGPKYLTVRIDDIGAIPYQPALGQFKFWPVYFQAKNRWYYDPNDNFKRKLANESCWQNIGTPMKLSNRPECLPTSYWNGSFEPRDASYHFLAKSDQNTNSTQPLGPSNEMPIDMPDVDAGGIPSYGSNDSGGGFTSRFMAYPPGKWSQEEAAGTSSGNTLGNDLQGQPLMVQGSEVPAGAGGGGVDFPHYEWSTNQEIFSLNIETSIFEAIIFAGTIGPVPVTVWASVGLGIDFLIEFYTYVKVSPFGPLENGNLLDFYFDLFTRVGISIPCEIRADILGGLASINMWLRPEVLFTFLLVVALGIPEGVTLPNYSTDDMFYLDYCLSSTFTLYFGMEFCLFFGLGCFGTGDVALIGPLDIIPPHNIPTAGPQCDPTSRPEEGGGYGGGGLFPEVSGLPGGRGGDSITIGITQSSIAPVTIISPDRKTIVDIWVTTAQGTLMNINVLDTETDEVQVVKASPIGLSFFVIDPAASFVSNDAVMLSWTMPAWPVSSEIPSPDDPDAYLPAVNANSATSEIYAAALVRMPGEGWILFDAESKHYPVRLMDQEIVPQPTSRADGKPSVAGDLASGDSMLAWVRYDGDYMVLDGTTLVNQPCEANCGRCRSGLACKFTRQVEVNNYRPQMEVTSIYARRVGYRIEFVPMQGDKAFSELHSEAFKISPPGINIEPSISLSPSGNKGYCVWLHDSSTDPITGEPHVDLISSSRGRQILYAVYTKNAADLDDPNQWSAPDGVLAAPDDYPALLEPEICLSGDDSGLLIFTALDKSASNRDSGLGGNRFLYACRLEGGVFGEPFRIHGKCFKREFAAGGSVTLDIPDLIDPTNVLKWKNPEWVMVYQGAGVLGSRASSGNVMVTTLGKGSNVWSAPMSLTPDNRMHSNVAACIGPAGIHSIHLDGGVASLGARLAQARSGGGIDAKKFVTMNSPMLPDPAITGMFCDFPFASPGSIVKATVEVENKGLRGTALNASTGASALGVELSLGDDVGRFRRVAAGFVPEIQPGEKRRIAIDVEMPMEPAVLRAELVCAGDLGNKFDGDTTNNLQECSLGAPAPTDFACRPIPFTSYDGNGMETATLGVELNWSNAAVYDEIFIYRDRRLISSVPGKCRRWVDQYTHSGTHTYELRGRIIVSKSARTACIVNVSMEGFFRGDVDGSRVVDITDAINLLNYLFLGGKEPTCQDAADADDNGKLEITDSIRILNFLFLGGEPPAAPGPKACGPDTTPDTLPACGTVCK